jgi:hypothetical protein
MAQLGQTFNPNDVPDGEPTDLLPSGLYHAQIIESDVVVAKSGRGQIVNLTWEILDGPHEKRRVWSRVNYLHENQTAQDIGQRFLKQITDALGLGPISDTDELMWKPVAITVGIEKSKDAAYGDKNKVTKVAPLGNARAAAPPARQPASTATPAATNSPPSRPWDRKKVA